MMRHDPGQVPATSKGRAGNMKPIRQWITAALVAVAMLGTGIATADAQTKKVIRINHAGADDILGTEHQMFCLDLRELREPEGADARRQALSQQRARPVAAGDRGDAARLGREHAYRRHGGVRQFLPGEMRRDRAAVHLQGLRPRAARARRPGRRGAVGRARESRLQGARLPLFLGLSERRDRQEGDQDRRRPQGPEDPDHPDAGLRRRRSTRWAPRRRR